MTGNGWVLHSAILVETPAGVSLSQAAAAKITVSPSSVFYQMTSPNTGQSYATTITVSNCPTQPTISISMDSGKSGGLDVILGDAAYTTPVSAGLNTWTFKIYPTRWQTVVMNPSGSSMVPGEYCQGTCTVRLAVGNTASVSIRGNIDTGIIP